MTDYKDHVVFDVLDNDDDDGEITKGNSEKKNVSNHYSNVVTTTTTESLSHNGLELDSIIPPPPPPPRRDQYLNYRSSPGAFRVNSSLHSSSSSSTMNHQSTNSCGILSSEDIEMASSISQHDDDHNDSPQLPTAITDPVVLTTAVLVNDDPTIYTATEINQNDLIRQALANSNHETENNDAKDKKSRRRRQKKSRRLLICNVCLLLLVISLVVLVGSIWMTNKNDDPSVSANNGDESANAKEGTEEEAETTIPSTQQQEDSVINTTSLDFTTFVSSTTSQQLSIPKDNITIQPVGSLQSKVDVGSTNPESTLSHDQNSSFLVDQESSNRPSSSPNLHSSSSSSNISSSSSTTTTPLLSPRASSSSNQAKFWEHNDNDEQQEYGWIQSASLGTNNMKAKSVALSADGSIAAISYVDGTIHVLEQRRSQQQQTEQQGKEEWSTRAILNSTVWEIPQEGGFANDIDLNDNGDILIVGSPFHNKSKGIVHVIKFSSDGKAWKQMGQSLVGHSNFDHFGASVSISGDGTTIAVGAWNGGPDNCGYAKVFALTNQDDGETWNLVGNRLIGNDYEESSSSSSILGGVFGSTVILSKNGKIVSVADEWYGSKRGRVATFKLRENIWIPHGQALVGTFRGDRLGQSIALSGNGKRLVVIDGGSRARTINMAHVYEFSSIYSEWMPIGTIPIETSADFVESTTNSACFSHDGNVLAIGSRGGTLSPESLDHDDNNDGGAIRVFSFLQGESEWDPIGLIQVGSGNSISATLSAQGNDLLVGDSQIYTFKD